MRIYLKALISLLFLCLLPSQTLANNSHESDNEVDIAPLAEGVWVHTSYHTFSNGLRYPSNGLIVKEGNTLTLIDTAWGIEPTKVLLDKIQRTIGLAVTKAIVTHHHDDRVAGVATLQARGVEVYAHPMTRQLVTENGGTAPNRSLNDISAASTSMELGKLTVLYPGPAHAADNIMIWLADERILFGGCPIRAMDASTMGNTADGDLASWQIVVSTLMKQYSNAQIVVPGHGASGGTELLSHTHSLLMNSMVD
ncbi:subclass B1 metallo-beta-lactamase [Kordiimonas sp.]|uniref:subclass B1 metallo-beta-lactamase n=1 Tax=Kordiimonas sp. TaxID=1970157 RepID=UPI003A8D23C0